MENNNYKKKNKKQFIIIIIVLLLFQFLIEINYLLHKPVILEDIPTATTSSISPKIDDTTETTTSSATIEVITSEVTDTTLVNTTASTSKKTTKKTTKKRTTKKTTKKVKSKDNTIIVNDDEKIDVSFDNVNIIHFVSSNDIPIISGDGKKVSFDIVLEKPNDSYSFSVDMKNNNSFDIKVDNIISNVLTKTQSTYLKFSLGYSDGTAIKIGDVIKSGQKKKIIFTVLYKDDVDPISTDVTANYQGQITFVQAE